MLRSNGSKLEPAAGCHSCGAAVPTWRTDGAGSRGTPSYSGLLLGVTPCIDAAPPAEIPCENDTVRELDPAAHIKLVPTSMVNSGAARAIEHTVTPSMTALTSGADGLKPYWLTGLPLGYHPSSKYWRTKTAAPATMGVAMDVPMSMPTSQLVWPTLPLLPLQMAAHVRQCCTSSRQSDWARYVEQHDLGYVIILQVFQVS